MKHARRIKTVFLLLLAAVIALLGGTAAHMSRRQERYQVAMIVKSTESAFFQSVFAGQARLQRNTMFHLLPRDRNRRRITQHRTR